MTTMLLAVLIGVAFSGGAGLGTGGVQMLDNATAAPAVFDLRAGMDLGLCELGGIAGLASWHTGYPDGQQVALVTAMQTVGLPLQGTLPYVGMGISDLIADPRSGGDDPGVDPALCYTFGWRVPFAGFLEADAHYIYTTLASAPVIGALSLRWTW